MPWLERQIQDMAYLKLNLLHLHLTDNEAFRLESATVPSAVSPEHYTKQQIAGLVALAGRYHITVVPEFDMPSHLAAVLSTPAYANLAISPATRGAIDIGNPAARDLMAGIITEYLPLFPGKYWDIGADEYVSNYSAYPSLVNYAHSHFGANAPPIDTFYDFVNSMATLVGASGKTPRMWNDQLTTAAHPEVPLAAGIVVDYWNGNSTSLLSPDQLVANGNPVMNASWSGTVDGVAHTILYYVLGSTKPENAVFYERWNPLMFDVSRSLNPANAGSLLGAQLNVWCDTPHQQTQDQVAIGIRPTLRVLAQQTWGSPRLTTSYATFQSIIAAVGSPVPLGESMAVVRPADGRLMVFAAGSGGTVSVRRQVAPNSGWGPWTALGGNGLGSVAAAVNSAGQVEVFGVGPYGRISVSTQAGDGWGSWSSAPGGQNVGGVAAATDGQGVHLFALGADLILYHSTQQANGSWSGWDGSLGGSQLRSISAAASPTGQLRVFAVGGDGIMYQRVRAADGSWSGWDGSLVGSDLRATAASTGAGWDVYAIGGDEAAYGRSGGTNGAFQSWASYAGTNLEQLTAGRNADGRAALFSFGSDNRYYTKYQQTDGSWTDWQAW